MIGGENGSIKVFVVSDRLQPLPAQLNLSLLDFEGNKLWGQKQDIEIVPLTSKSYLTVPVTSLLAGKDPKSVFLFTEVLMNGKRVSNNSHFFEAYKNLALPRSEVRLDIARVRGGFRVTLSSDKLARAVYLSAPAYTGFFTDNYFDLIPGKEAQVEFRAAQSIPLNDFRKQLKVRTMADAF